MAPSVGPGGWGHPEGNSAKKSANSKSTGTAITLCGSSSGDGSLWFMKQLHDGVKLRLCDDVDESNDRGLRKSTVYWLWKLDVTKILCLKNLGREEGHAEACRDRMRSKGCTKDVDALNKLLEQCREARVITSEEGYFNAMDDATLSKALDACSDALGDRPFPSDVLARLHKRRSLRARESAFASAGASEMLEYFAINRLAPHSHEFDIKRVCLVDLDGSPQDKIDQLYTVLFEDVVLYRVSQALGPTVEVSIKAAETTISLFLACLVTEMEAFSEEENYADALMDMQESCPLAMALLGDVHVGNIDTTTKLDEVLPKPANAAQKRFAEFCNTNSHAGTSWGNVVKSWSDARVWQNTLLSITAVLNTPCHDLAGRIDQVRIQAKESAPALVNAPRDIKFSVRHLLESKAKEIHAECIEATKGVTPDIIVAEKCITLMDCILGTCPNGPADWVTMKGQLISAITMTKQHALANNFLSSCRGVAGLPFSAGVQVSLKSTENAPIVDEFLKQFRTLGSTNVTWGDAGVQDVYKEAFDKLVYGLVEDTIETWDDRSRDILTNAEKLLGILTNQPAGAKEAMQVLKAIEATHGATDAWCRLADCQELRWREGSGRLKLEDYQRKAAHLKSCRDELEAVEEKCDSARQVGIIGDAYCDNTTSALAEVKTQVTDAVAMKLRESMRSFRPTAKGGKDGQSWQDGVDDSVQFPEYLRIAEEKLFPFDGKTFIERLAILQQDKFFEWKFEGENPRLLVKQGRITDAESREDNLSVDADFHPCLREAAKAAKVGRFQ
ncbi:unnamed protein product [Prorocentrum cordatum]|uniref:Uncharacterized protein n=1 Tax=Prorocentrum cordatum TaxID=2364126 RepID=A0ABN9PPY5_9DINO|nr:unnamed protein product [Polarella glacialis]